MISVAVAAYNGERFIEEQLESIRNQTVRVDEVVIGDDCSTDNTVEICRAFIEKNALSNWRVVERAENRGYCHNFYDAIADCSGDFIFLADQDDVWHEDKVEKMIACMESHPELKVLSSRYGVIDADTKPIENSGVTYLGDCYDDSLELTTTESMIGCSYIRGFSICMRKELKEILRPIDLKNLLSHDWLISILGTLQGSTGILNTVLTEYRYHGDNVTLSAMSRKTRVRRLEKRIRGLYESIEGHSYVMSLLEDAALLEAFGRFIAFEQKRLRFLETKNIFCWMSLVFQMRQYDRYYKGGGLRVWLGDLSYVLKGK